MRNMHTLASFTRDYRGYVMPDGLKGYLVIGHHLNCWVHAQRGFKNIVKANKKASAFYYSMVETAKLNGVNVADYLWYCLDEAPRCKTDSDWEKLLPWNMDTIKIAELKKRRASALPDAMRTEPYVLRGAH